MQLIGKNPRVIVKTANFTVDPTTIRAGTIFSTRGAGGAVTFTLPNLSGAAGGTWDGYWVEFIAEADQTMTVTAAAGKAIAVNNLAATSLAASTGGQKIGASILATWDAGAAKWVLQGNNSGITYTVA